MTATTTTTANRVVSDPSIPNGHLHGYNAAGELVVQLQYMPEYHRILGDERDERTVVKWLVSPDGARRVASIAAWNATGNGTRGNA